MLRRRRRRRRQSNDLEEDGRGASEIVGGSSGRAPARRGTSRVAARDRVSGRGRVRRDEVSTARQQRAFDAWRVGNLRLQSDVMRPLDQIGDVRELMSIRLLLHAQQQQGKEQGNSMSESV